MAQNILFNTNTKSKHLILEHWWVDEGEVIHLDQQIASIRDGDRIYLLKAPNEGILFEKYVSNNESFDKTKPLGKIISKEEAGNIKISGKLSETERKIIDSIQKEKIIPPKKRIHIKASPSARRKARQNNINLEDITGTGPNGRIQLRDVKNYIQEHQSMQIKTYKNKVLRYNLPLTGLARRLAQKHNLDISKIPASPDAVRIKRKDVERYLRNPEGAAEELEREYNIHDIENLENPIIPQTNNLPISQSTPEEVKTEEPTVIRLTTEEPNEIPSNEEIIQLDTEVILALNNIVNNLLLAEPPENTGTVIKLNSDEENIIPSYRTIYLDSKEKLPELLQETVTNLLQEPVDEPVIIRLPTEEPERIPSSKTIELQETKEETDNKPKVVEEENSQKIVSDIESAHQSDMGSKSIQTSHLEKEVLDLKSEKEILSQKDLTKIQNELNDIKASLEDLEDEFEKLEQRKTSSNIAQLSTLVNLNLIDLVKKYNPPKNEIGLFLKNYILSVIYSVFKDIKTETKEIYYIADVRSGSISSYKSHNIDQIKKDIVNNLDKREKVNIPLDKLEVVELLAYNIDDVSGLIDPNNKIVLYLSYIKQVDKFFYESISIRSILKLTLEFDKNSLSAEEGIEFIEELRQRLEKLEVQD